VRDGLRVAFWAGLVLFVMGLVSYALTGVFDLWTAVHVAGGGALLIASIVLNLADVRQRVAAKGTRQRAQALSGTVVFAAILVAVNILAARYPKTWDATESKVYTLGERTRAVLRGLSAPVEIAAFVPPGDRSRPELEDILRRYAALSPKLSWRFVDAEKEPQAADKFGVTRAGVVAALCGKEKAQTSGDAAGAFGEGELTSLILKVARPGSKIVYTITGHGEPEPTDMETPAGFGLFAQTLAEDNITLKPLLLATQTGIPEDAAAVVLAGPVKPLIPHEIDALRAYLARGGRVLLLLNPGQDAGLAPLLTDYRLGVDDDMIVDQEEIAFLGARLGVDPIIDDFPPHPITKGFKQRIILSQARSVHIGTEGGLPGVVAQPLARTHETAWGETGWRAMLSSGRVEKNDDDKAGPLLVASTATAPIAGKGDDAEHREARVALFGDADWAANGNLQAFFNRELLLNTMHWVTGSEDLIVGPAKRLRASRLDMTVADERNLFRFGVLLLPEALLIAGLAAWVRRKSL